MKTHRGITAMLKNSIIVLFIIVLVVSILIYYKPSSEEYWGSIGPSWDRMLNPNKYSEQE
jgi:hypothetical protein